MLSDLGQYGKDHASLADLQPDKSDKCLLRKNWQTIELFKINVAFILMCGNGATSIIAFMTWLQHLHWFITRNCLAKRLVCWNTFHTIDSD